MLYRKNVRNWEQVLRIVAGLAVAAGGLVVWPGLASGYAVATSGVFLAVTGIFGYCPACALVGRKLDGSKP